MNLSSFNENQKKAVLHKDGACCVIAGAGSGKTRVLTYRIAHLIEEGIPAQNILAVTFTKKASEEMKNRLKDLIGIEAEEVHMGTFHSICYSILRNEVAKFASADVAQEWWQKKIMKEILSPPSTKYPFGLNMPHMQPRQALSWIGYQKNHLLTPKSKKLIISEGMEFMEDKLRKMYKLYEDKKELENKIDFDDMLIECYHLFKNHPKVLKKYQNLFQYILVDEYQDTNKAQDEIVKLLGAKYKNVFVVGDWRQSIYGFRASDVNIILNFKNDWEEAKIIHLDINYRSTSNIVEWANRLIRKANVDLPTITIPHKPRYQDPVIIKAENEDEEAEIITTEIEEFIEDGIYQPKDFAILYRTNAQSRALEEALMKAQIPYIILSGQNFYKRKEIKDMLAYLRLSQNLDNDLELERILNRPNRFLGKKFAEELIIYATMNGLSYYKALNQISLAKQWRYQGAGKLHRLLTILSKKDLPPAEMIKFIREETDYDNWLINDDTGDDLEDDRLENLRALQTVATKFTTVKDFLEYVDIVGSNTNSKDDKANKVKLMTIHRSKGLEFPVVYVAGVSDGLLPHGNASTEEEIEEERRLCYVAMTRAEKLLRLSFTEEYQMKSTGASMFIEELLEDKEEEVPVWL